MTDHRVPPRSERVTAPVGAPVTIDWDTWGVPHIRAESQRDVFFGLGYAMAQERLWQLDYMRRLAKGELAAVGGPSAVASDRSMRYLELARTAAMDWAEAPAEVAEALNALAAGINLWIERVEALPVEFEMLGYRPRPWDPTDSIAIWKYRWWYNTGRLESTALAELAKRALPPDLLEQFLASELPEETIVPDRAGGLVPGGDSGEGSNNWVVGPSKSASGKPILCSDPHNPFAAPSQWFDAQLTAPGLDAIGAIYQGLPTVYIGRTRHAAWGVTNHNATARDIYVETLNDAGQYRDGEHWRHFELAYEDIEVAGADLVRFTRRRTVRGPVLEPGNGLLADHLIKALGNPLLSMRWVGHERGTGLDAGLALQQAKTAEEVLAALSRWPCPPLNFVYATADGRLGYHTAGYIPQRPISGHGLRDGADATNAWREYVPFIDMPHLHDPPRGWAATANNPPFSTRTNRHYLSVASWADGYRFRRIRQRLTEHEKLSRDQISAIQADVESPRARDLVPRLLVIVGDSTTASKQLADWDFRLTEDSVAASIWIAFWDEWTRELARVWFPGELLTLAAARTGAVGRVLLLGEKCEWLPADHAGHIARRCFDAALARLTKLAGPEVAEWRWGRFHTVEWRHPLHDRDPSLSTGPHPTSGDVTVRATSHGVGTLQVASGATYRFVADFSEPMAHSTTNLGQSGHASSPHYRDQTRLWLADEYKPLWMEPADVAANLEGTTVLSPAPA